MNDLNLIVINGKLIPAEEATVSAFDPGFLYGETIFTTLGVKNSSCCFLERHLKRLLSMASVLKLPSLPRPEQLRDGAELLLASISDSPRLLRITLTPGHLSGYRLDRDVPGPSSWIIAPVFRTEPDIRFYQSGVSTEIATIPALPSRDPRTFLKTGNLLLSRWLRKRKPPSRFELLMKNSRGYLLEGTVSNLFFLLRDNTVLTPPEHWGVLPGVIREVLIEMLAKREIPLRWGSLTTRTLDRAKGAFLTNSYLELLPVRNIFPSAADLDLPEEGEKSPLWQSEGDHPLFSLLRSDILRLENEERRV